MKGVQEWLGAGRVLITCRATANAAGFYLSTRQFVRSLYGYHYAGSCVDEANGENNSYRSRCDDLQIQKRLLAGPRRSLLLCVYAFVCIVKNRATIEEKTPPYLSQSM
ncbi:hypothetical protein NL676_001967 [Syzygium grande]|nr:hypothetical protein NL676_001967 [Syzygium grande]